MGPSASLLSVSRPITMLMVIAIYMAAMPRNLPVMALLTVSAGFFVVSSAVIVRWISAPEAWESRLIWAEIALASLVNGVGVLSAGRGTLVLLFFPPAVTLFFCLSRRHWWMATLAVLAGWVLTSLPDWTREAPMAVVTEVGIYGALFLFASGVGMLVRSLGDEKQRSEQLLEQVTDSSAKLERTYRQLQDSLASQQESAVLEERARLARDIHDGVAHVLTALVVQAQAARRLLERSPELAAPALARCEELAREALQETRGAVRALHPAGLGSLADAEALRRLARDFGAATGMEIHLEAEPETESLPPDPVRLEHLYRIFQESLTNAHRHGQALTVGARLGLASGLMRLEITNDGLPPRSLEPGMGLTSMAQRVRSLGGTLEVEPGARGVTIRVTIPVDKGVVL